MRHTSYRHVVRGTHSAARLSFPPPRVSASTTWLGGCAHLSSAAPAPTSSPSTALAPRLRAMPARSHASVPRQTPLRVWGTTPHYASVSHDESRCAERRASVSTPASSSASATSAGDVSGDAELARWRAAAFAQAQLVVQLVHQQRRTQRLQSCLLSLLARYRHLTTTAKALGLDASERRRFRAQDKDLQKAATALEHARSGAEASANAEHVLAQPTPASVSLLSQREAVALFQEEAVGLTSAGDRRASSMLAPQDPFFLLTALFDAVLFLSPCHETSSGASSSGTRSTSAPQNRSVRTSLASGGSLSAAVADGAVSVTVDTTAARRCFDWLLQHQSTSSGLPREVCVPLWVRVVSMGAAKPHGHHRDGAAPTRAPPPDAAAAHWELSSMKTLTRLFPLAAARTDMMRPSPCPVTTQPSALDREELVEAARHARDLDRQWRSLERLESLGATPSSTQWEVAAARRDTSEACGEHTLRLVSDSAFYARCLQQRLFFPKSARGGTLGGGLEAMSLDALFHLFCHTTVAVLRRPSAPTQGTEPSGQLSREWFATVVEAACVWVEASRPDEPLRHSAQASPCPTRDASWYAARDLFESNAKTPDPSRPPPKQVEDSPAPDTDGVAHSVDTRDTLVELLVALCSAAAALSACRDCVSLLCTRLLRAMAPLCARLPQASHTALVDSAYGLVWYSARSGHTGVAHDALYSVLLTEFLLPRCARQPHACHSRGELHRLLWCFGCVLKRSPGTVVALVPEVLESIVRTPIPLSEKAVVALEVARTVTASGLVLSAAAHVAMQRCLLLGAPARPFSASKTTAPEPKTLPSASREPVWRRQRARWSSAEAWYTAWCDHTGGESKAGPEVGDGARLVLLQSSIRCSLAMGQVESAMSLIQELASVRALSHRTDFSPRLASLHALLCFCAMDDTQASRDSARRLSVALLREAPADVKQRYRETWRAWYQRAAHPSTLDVTDEKTATVVPPPPRFRVDEERPLPVAAAAIDGTQAVSHAAAHVVNALLRHPFGAGVHQYTAWPLCLWQRNQGDVDVTLEASVLGDLVTLDSHARAALEREADLVFTLNSHNGIEPSHWHKLCAAPLRRTATMALSATRAGSAAAPSPSPASPCEDTSTAVKTHFLAAAAAIMHHPRSR